MRRSDFLARFKKWVQNDPDGPQVAESTATKYGRIAKGFMKEVGHPARVSTKALHLWRQKIVHTRDGRKASPSTVLVKISAVKALFSFAVAEGHRAKDPTEGIRVPTVERGLPRPLDRNDIERMFDSIDGTDPMDVQDVAILETLYGSGLRRLEAGNLTFGNIQGRDILRLFGKGGTERLVPMTESQYEALKEWCLLWHGDTRSEELTKLIDDDAAFTELRQREEMQDVGIFVREDGTPFREMADPGFYIWERIKKIREDANVKATPHQLRHSFATHLLNNGADIYSISQALAHKNLETTKIYTKVQDDAVRRLSKQHPRAVAKKKGGE